MGVGVRVIEFLAAFAAIALAFATIGGVGNIIAAYDKWITEKLVEKDAREASLSRDSVAGVRR